MLVSIVTSDATYSGSILLRMAAQRMDCEVTVCLVSDIQTPARIDTSDAVVYRISPRNFENYQQILQKINNPVHQDLLKRSLAAFDKCTSYQILAAASVDMPVSHIVDGTTQPPFLPGVLKIPRGNQGKGVTLVTSLEAYQAILQEYATHFGQCLYQEYIAESEGVDKRLIICGNRVVAAMQRSATNGEFRANIHLGAHASAYQPTDIETSIALQAVAALGIPFAGVDIIDSQRGPLVLEVNPSPGLAISNITNIDVPTAIIRCVVEKVNYDRSIIN